MGASGSGIGQYLATPAIGMLLASLCMGICYRRALAFPPTALGAELDWWVGTYTCLAVLMARAMYSDVANRRLRLRSHWRAGCAQHSCYSLSLTPLVVRSSGFTTWCMQHVFQPQNVRGHQPPFPADGADRPCVAGGDAARAASSSHRRHTSTRSTPGRLPRRSLRGNSRCSPMLATRHICLMR
jgi:hypothetical protein